MFLEELSGQDQAVCRLKGYLSSGRVDGGYLFVGPEGIGKFRTACIFAQALNCSVLSDDACGRCPSCLKIQKGVHPDVHLIDRQEEEIKIEDIRTLQETASLRPYEARKAVFIVNNAHQLNPVSGNAFLKTLEEPPQDCVMVLVTHKPALLLRTIVSRCRVVKFGPMSRQILADLLASSYGMERQSGRFLAYFSEGRLGAAVRLKDSDLWGDKNRIIDQFIVRQDSGTAARIKDRVQLRWYLNVLATWFRDVYLYKLGLPREELIHQDRLNQVALSAGSYSGQQLDDVLETICQTLTYLDQNVNMKLLITNLLLSLQPRQ